MSTFTVTPAHLRQLAAELITHAEKIRALDLPDQDYVGWTGSPQVGLLISDFDKTAARNINIFVENLSWLHQALTTGASQYAETERQAAGATRIISAVGPGAGGHS